MTLKSLAACLVLGLGPCAVELLLHTSPSLDIRRPRFRTLPGRPQLENKFEIASDLVPCHWLQWPSGCDVSRALKVASSILPCCI